jgi:fucose permease
VLQTRRQRAALILITFIAFISLGLPDGLLDIANPRIRAAFDIGPDVFSLIFLTGLTGYFLSSFFAGQLVMRLGIGKLLAASCLATALALIGNAVSPAWVWFVVLGLMGGAGAGAIDSGLNTYVATHYGPRLMFWLHASFGLGVTSGTWLMSVVVNSGESWRWGYAIVGTLQIGLALSFFLTRKRFNRPRARTDEPAAPPVHTPIRATLRIPLVWLGIGLFFLYTGVEITAGRWASSLFMEGRDISPETAGIWVSAYWGMFTVGRVAAGFVGRWRRCSWWRIPGPGRAGSRWG